MIDSKVMVNRTFYEAQTLNMIKTDVILYVKQV